MTNKLTIGWMYPNLLNLHGERGSVQMLESAFAQWHELSVQWLHKTFGKPVHVDKNTSRMAQLMVELGYTPDGRIA